MNNHPELSFRHEQHLMEQNASCTSGDFKCPHFHELIRLTERLESIHVEFEQFRHDCRTEKEDLKSRLETFELEKNQLTEKNDDLESALKICKQQLKVSQENPKEHIAFTEQLLREKNVEISGLRQKVNELMDANRRLYITKDHESFEKDNQKSNFQLALKEKDIQIQRLKTEAERLYDSTDKERLQSKSTLSQFKQENMDLKASLEETHRLLETAKTELEIERKKKALPQINPAFSKENLETKLRARIMIQNEALLNLKENREAREVKAKAFNLWFVKFKRKQAEKKTHSK